MNKNISRIQKTTESYEGVLERISFQDPSTGFMAGKFRTRNPVRLFSFNGNLYNVSEGDNLRLIGQWQEHPTYGPQFKVFSFNLLEPQSIKGIETYLASGRFKYIGEKTAQQIVQRFGATTLDIIDKTPGKLLSLPLINEKKLTSLKEGRAEIRGAEDVYVFLHMLELPPSVIRNIFNKYGLEAIAAIKENPYRLAHEVKGIGFKIADTIAARQKIPKNSPQRAQAALLYFLDQFALGGHTCYPRMKLIQHVLRELFETEVAECLTENNLQEAVEQLLTEKLLREENNGNLLFLNYYYQAEASVASQLYQLLMEKTFLPFTFSSSALQHLESKFSLVLDSLQRKAIQAIIQNKVIVLTGGPGTGKTTIIRFVLQLLDQSAAQIDLATPTGKASKRLAEATGKEAKTIHRHLEFSRKGPGRTKENPLECDLLILDECSMIDISLFRMLLNALPSTSRLVMIGDPDQLPSIGAGAVLRDILLFTAIPNIRLKQIFRQGESSLISVQAHQIIQGRELIAEDGKSEAETGLLSDFHFISIPKRVVREGRQEQKRTDHERILHNLIKLFTERIPSKFGIPCEEIQILSPIKMGALGTENINLVVKKTLFNHLSPFRFGTRQFFLGDRVMQIKNDYEKEVFNGDQGFVVKGTKDSLHVNFDGREIVYKEKDIDNLLPAWAATIHKSQGSEFPAVIIVLSDQHHIMLQRNLLYTAVTRGKKLVVILGEKTALNKAIRNESIVQRHTYLRERLEITFAGSLNNTIC